MPLSTEQLLSFVKVAEFGSIAEAARQLKKSRATVSESIANLELDLGFALLDRSRRDIALTENAQAILVQSKIAVMHLQRLSQLASSVLAKEESEFTIAYDGHIPVSALSGLALALKQAFPHTRVNLHRCFGEQVKLAVGDTADVAFVLSKTTDAYEGLSFKQVGYFSQHYVVAEHHPLNGQSCSSAQLSCYPQLFLGAGYSKSFMARGLKSPNWSFVESLEVLQEVLTQTDNWSILASQDAEALVEKGGFAVLQPEFLALQPRLAIDLIWQSELEVKAVKQRVIEQSAQYFAKLR
ncbi:DNA-binding transcriptional LysR family regulator [Sinobacterium caligoides]|uniref:DNA-binding transcriptional LysR family regulator n=1 Tax=Sinobacterium caligoides TaxID=933926 RepID=A0A3N2DQZ0_9GAMM|nr:LysR family transcriptional regulator [Sinobacterium caligoides]ROS01715.1 DNA-binding transcriptional LysR family regulator [Sinobacterium caligoides]